MCEREGECVNEREGEREVSIFNELTRTRTTIAMMMH